MKTAVDTNVLLDIVSDDSAFSHDAGNAIYRVIAAGLVVISPVVFAELAVAFLQDKQGLDRFLQQLGIRVEAFSTDAMHQAARAWTAYLRGRGDNARCRHCGQSFPVICPSCRNEITWRQRVMPDFLVGAHALVQADILLTRDPRRYGTYFPDLATQSPQDRAST